MKLIYILFILAVFFSSELFSQTGESRKVYDDSQVAVIEISVNQEDLDYMYAHPDSDSLHFCSVHFKNALIDETIDSVGLRFRGNTSRESQKKSFKLSFNELIPGRKFHGVKKINLNGEHNDPSIMRSKIAWDLAKQMGMTASRAAHAAVYINNKYYGLYISVEHIDDEFISKNFDDDSGNLWKCLYPADLKYKGDSPDLYKSAAYELNTNEEINDYSQLARLIKIINLTPLTDLPDSLESLLDISSVLKYFTLNTLIGSWDDYRGNKSNYYLYCAPRSNKFYCLPYDYDNTFGVDWFNKDWAKANPYSFPKLDNSARPLSDRILADPQYRNLFTHFLEFYNTDVFRPDSVGKNIDRLKSLIVSYAVADIYRTMDYGFTVSDFYNSYNETSFINQHVKRGLKEFVNVRNSSLPAQLNYLPAVKPVIYKVDYSPKHPGFDDSVYVSVSAFSNAGLKALAVNLSEDGILSAVQMKNNPVENTKVIEETDRWTCTLPPLMNAKDVNMVISAEDVNSLIEEYPRSKDIVLRTAALPGSLVINELLADNLSINKDEKDQFEDWLEIYNNSAQSIDLSGKYVTDNPANLDKWQIPAGTTLAPSGHLLIWCDEDSSDGIYHANFKLSTDGEFLALVDNDGVSILDSLTFPAQTTDVSYGRYPDGSEGWQKLYPTPAKGNSLTAINEDAAIPHEFKIAAYPNPFNPSVNINYSLPQNSDVLIKIYDMLGKEIFSRKELNKTAGKYNFTWDAANYSTGTYICTIQADHSTKTVKLLFLK